MAKHREDPRWRRQPDDFSHLVVGMKAKVYLGCGWINGDVVAVDRVSARVKTAQGVKTVWDGRNITVAGDGN